ncbi:glycosyltransferase family 4 protein [Candidatus Peregrinibacteria bacterium]|nr:glycosyltransferase family 4 protein [Candidatus Peregrinibacteria bacterium]
MIFIDASRYSNTEKRTGVENYSYFLINELIKNHLDEIILISPKKISLDVKQIIIPFPRLWTQIRLSWEIFKNRKIDNIFVPSHVLPIVCTSNSTITIHDVAWKHIPESYGFLSSLYLNWGTKFAVKHANKIIVPSEVTKNDLIKFFKADSKKIHVIPLGFQSPEIKLSENDEQKIINHWSLNIGHYFLFIGRIEHKKNTDTLIKAFAEFSKTNPDIKLVLAGSVGRGGEEIIKNIPDEVRDKIVITGYVHDKEKHTLYKNALCFVFPSRYEGFGIPLLEAMSYNLPIIASKIPTSEEIAGSNVEFFELLNTKTLENIMKKVISERGSKKDYSEVLSKYSWEKNAEKTWEILKFH